MVDPIAPLLGEGGGRYDQHRAIGVLRDGVGDVGDALCRAGWSGLLASSPARPEAQVVCVFDLGTWPPAGCEPLRTVEIAEVPLPPTGMAT
jgi:hypothetical protein